MVRHKKTALAFGLLIIIYLVQALFAPIDETARKKYGLSVGELRALMLTIVIPYVVIWLIALIGYLKLRSYADLIKGSKDGEAFSTIAKGLLFFVIWLPISTIVQGFFRQYYQAHPSVTDTLTIINNYFNILLLLPAFWFVKSGSEKLLAIIKKPINTMPAWAMMVYVAVSAVYVLLVLHDPARTVPHDTSVASYYQSDWLIVITLVIPRLITWFWGLQAVINILIYRAHVKGRLYKVALNNLAVGLAGILITTILLRFLQSLTVVLNHWSLGVLLAVIYLLLIAISVGYAFIAAGARDLQKLEEL